MQFAQPFPTQGWGAAPSPGAMHAQEQPSATTQQQADAYVQQSAQQQPQFPQQQFPQQQQQVAYEQPQYIQQAGPPQQGLGQTVQAAFQQGQPQYTQVGPPLIGGPQPMPAFGPGPGQQYPMQQHAGPSYPMGPQGAPGQFAGLLPSGASPGQPQKAVGASSTLEVFLYFGGWYGLFFWVFNVLVFVHKGVELLYPNDSYDAFAMEWSFAWLYIIVDIPRISYLNEGNRKEQWIQLSIGIVFTLPLLALHIYYINWQIYVFKIDLFTNALALAIMGVQLLFAIVMVVQRLLAGRFKPQAPVAGPPPISVPGGAWVPPKQKTQ